MNFSQSTRRNIYHLIVFILILPSPSRTPTRHKTLLDPPKKIEHVVLMEETLHVSSPNQRQSEVRKRSSFDWKAYLLLLK